MQIAASIAVVLVAFSVMTDCGSDDSAAVTVTEPTLSQKFENFQREVQSFVDRVGEKAKAAFHDLHHSEFSNKTRNWFTKNFQKLKEKLKSFSISESN